jgi:hypothetical protein
MITVGTGSFSYDWNQGLGDGQNHTIVPDVSQTYMVTVTDENGCKGSSAINVIVNPTPMIALEGSLVLCNGLSNTLDAGAGFETYTWSTGDTTQTISVSEAGNYTIEVTDENMCFASEEVEIIDGTILSTEISGSLEFCMGDFSELDAGVGFGSYIWNTGDTSQTIIVTDAGEYTVTVSSPNSCDAEAEAIVIVNENPLVFAGEDVQICEGDSLDLFAEAVGGIAPYSYVWNEGLGEGQMHTISPETSTDYIVVAADVNQCLSEDTISINVSPAINVELSADSSLVISGGVMPFDTVYSIDGDSLSVLITDAFGCTAEDQVFVTGVEEIAIQLIDRIFPSPANEILYIEYYKNSYQDIQMKLIDINGRTAFSSYELLSQIHLTSFKSGTYILQIITKEGVQSVPVVIMH